MIGFRIGTDVLEMEPGTRIGLNLVNPLFSREIGYGSHSFSFTAPLTSNNRRTLLFMDNLYISSYNNEQDIEVLLGNNFWKQGTLKVLQASPTTEKASLAFNLDTSWLADKISTVRLADLDLGGTRTFAGATVGGTFEIRIDAGPTAVIAIQINDTLYSYTSALGNTMQELVDELKDQINADTNINATATTQPNGSFWQLVLSPKNANEPFQVLENIGATDIPWYQMSYMSSYLSAQDAMIAHMDTVGAAAVGAYDYAFPPVYNPDFFAEAVSSEYGGYVNGYEPGAGHTQPNDTTGEQYLSVCTPFVSVRYLLQQAAAWLGLTDISTFTSSDKIDALHLYNAVPVIQEGLYEGGGASETGYVGYFGNSFDLTNHVPSDMTVGELFADLADAFNLAIIVDPVVNTIDFVERKEAVTTDTKKDWTGKSLTGYSINYSDAQPVSYIYTPDDKDKLFEQGRVLNSILPGNAKHKVEVARPPLFDFKRQNPVDTTDWKTAEIRQQGYTTAAGLSPAEYRGRYLYYHGLQDNANNDSYPASSTDGKAYDDTQLITPSLMWDGAEGLYAQQHEAFEPFLYPDRNVTHNFLVDMLDLLSLSWTDAYVFRSRHGTHEGIIKSISMQLIVGERPPTIASAEIYLI